MDVRPTEVDASAMDARPAVEDVTKLCGHPISELAKSAKPGDANLLRVLYGVLRSRVGTPKERDEVLDSLLNIAHAGNADALRLCVELWKLPSIFTHESKDAIDSHILKRISRFFRQLAHEGRSEALLALTTAMDMVGMKRHPETRASFSTLILSFIAKEIPIETNTLLEFIERLTPEEQVNLMKSFVELAKGGNRSALHVLNNAAFYSSAETNSCFSAFFQKLKDNNSPAALNFDISSNQVMMSADEWLYKIKHAGRILSCNAEHLVEDASPEQMDKILLASFPSIMSNWVTSVMLQTGSEKVISSLERLAKADNIDAMVELGLFLVKDSAIADGKIRDGVYWLLESLKQGCIRARQNIRCIKFSSGYEERAKYIQEIVQEQVRTGNCKAEANVLLSYLLPYEQKRESFSLLLKADGLGKDVSTDIGLYLDRRDVALRTEALSYLARKAEAGNIDAKFFLGLHTRGSIDPLANNRAASLVMEALIHSQARYPSFLFGSAGADASPELEVLCGVSNLYSLGTESHGEPRLADFSAAFSE
jgi:TPR repeat protein